jgi:hypothetical protein
VPCQSHCPGPSCVPVETCVLCAMQRGLWARERMGMGRLTIGEAHARRSGDCLHFEALRAHTVTDHVRYPGLTAFVWPHISGRHCCCHSCSQVADVLAAFPTTSQGADPIYQPPQLPVLSIFPWTASGYQYLIRAGTFLNRKVFLPTGGRSRTHIMCTQFVDDRADK